MDTTRRDLLQWASATVVLSACDRLLPSGTGKLAGASAASGGGAEASELGLVVLATGAGAAENLSVFDLDTGQQIEVFVGYKTHAAVQHPRRKHLLVAVPKFGNRLAVIDLLERRVVADYALPLEKMFVGHAQFVDDDQLWISTAISKHGSTTTGKEFGDGLVSVFEHGSRLSHQGEFSSYGIGPHDCRLLAGQREVAIVNAAGPLETVQPADLPAARRSNLSIIDVKTRQLLEQIVVSDPNLHMNHFDYDGKDRFFVGDITRASNDNVASHEVYGNVYGRTSIVQRGGAVRVFSPPSDLQLDGPVLSVAFAPDGKIAAATSPSGIITIWDCNSGALLKKVDLDSPRGVALARDRASFIVTTDRAVYAMAIAGLGAASPLIQFEGKTDTDHAYVIERFA